MSREILVDLTVLGPCDDDGQLGVEADARHVLGVTLQRLHARLILRGIIHDQSERCKLGYGDKKSCVCEVRVSSPGSPRSSPACRQLLK